MVFWCHIQIRVDETASTNLLQLEMRGLALAACAVLLLAGPTAARRKVKRKGGRADPNSFHKGTATVSCVARPLNLRARFGRQ